ncbi:unnamed protein product [Rotaria socialis]|uniref:Ectonucleoside triphosphate diphosphohydrolase 5 n=1 Tax=Rotaria socialis TaxID=392032 RepID=A0A818NDS7_9BILA|nr:unnamed protein product [Rotaria socialis]CAF3313576.1 unnamed protein product [Rotaria socialis]CAF3341264.1 unnamed protein product [Rotaria socialis]CAF3498146.1 unnamed protein product [Rotaria socialis]CAF3603331.1 unnamed protein product [Rotaria socialis]
MSRAATATTYFEENSQEQHIRQRLSKTFQKTMIPLFHRRKSSANMFYLMRNLLFILILITFVLILYSSLSLSPLLRFLDPYSYVLVLDAGSTGTRLHVYKFRSSTDDENGDTFVLKSEIFKEHKPGLSSFADEIYKAEEQINDLLKIADQEVSRFKHRSTPLVLRATAGLRLLNETKQKLLLDSVGITFNKYGFYRPKMDIAVMNETEEGIDAWLTLVYLKGEQFYGSRIAALDLGGGSTQITYNPSLSNTSLAEKLNLLLKAQQPIEPGEVNAFRDLRNKEKKQMPRIDVNQADFEEIKPAKIVKIGDQSNSENKLSEEEILMKHMHQFRMFRRDIKLYSRSYLGYGLMIARQTIFINETNDKQLIESHQLRSRCFLNDITGKFKFQEIVWTVQSHQNVNSDERFYSCMALIDSYVGLNVQTAVGLDQMSIYVFSYFYDIANDAGLLSTEDDSSSITMLPIRVLKQTAKNVCSSKTTTSKEYPFLCFDLTYIYSLLTKGYGLSENTQIHICKKIQQFEVAWSLGLALKLL